MPIVALSASATQLALVLLPEAVSSREEVPTSKLDNDGIIHNIHFKYWLRHLFWYMSQT